MVDKTLILVVDDSNAIRTRMKEILTRHDYSVILRENGQEAILAALEYDPDLIVIDVNMPHMGGYEACKILKRYQQTRMIPIAVFTDNREIEKKVRFFDIGVEDFIVKDADEAEVIARISGLLRWKENRDRTVRDRNRLENLIDSLSDIVLITDTNGRLVFFNRPAVERFGLVPELLMEKSLTDILPEVEEILEQFTMLDEYEEFESVERELMRDGEKRVYLVSVCRVYIGYSEEVGVAVILKDVTSARETERIKAEFYSMIAHEFRTPISVILGYTQLILEGKAGEISGLQKEFLGGVEEKGRNLLNLVNDFLEVSRFESKFVKIERKEFDFSELLAETVKSLRLLAGNKNIDLTFSCDREPIGINADRDKMEHVFINLIENAIKYTKDGGMVTVTCMAREGGAETVIKDTGIGMSEKEIEYIFDRFKRLDNAQKKKIKGTGLGLAIVKEIVDAHEGCIEVESTEGVGSIFKVWIPGFMEHAEQPGASDKKRESVTSNNT